MLITIAVVRGYLYTVKHLLALLSFYYVYNIFVATNLLFIFEEGGFA